MKNNHPSEEMLQEYALDTQPADHALARHVNSCEGCKSKIAAYQFIAIGIRESPVPGFDFDLAADVLAQIPVTLPVASKAKWDYPLAAGFILLLTVPFFLYSHELEGLFNEVTGPIMYPAGALALFFLIIRVWEMDRSYHCRLNMINNSRPLQH